MAYTSIIINTGTCTTGDIVGIKIPSTLGDLEIGETYTLQFKARALASSTILDSIYVGTQQLPSIKINTFNTCILDTGVEAYLCYSTFVANANMTTPLVKIARTLTSIDASNTNIFEITEFSLTRGEFSDYNPNEGDFKTITEQLTTQVRQLAEAITLSAKREELDDIGEKLCKAIGQLQVEAGKISLMVQVGELSSLIEQMPDSVNIAFNGISSEWIFTDDEFSNNQDGKKTLSLYKGRLNVHSYNNNTFIGYIGSTTQYDSTNDKWRDGVVMATTGNAHYLMFGERPECFDYATVNTGDFEPIMSMITTDFDIYTRGVYCQGNFYMGSSYYMNMTNHLTAYGLKGNQRSTPIYNDYTTAATGGIEVYAVDGLSYLRPVNDEGVKLGSGSNKFRSINLLNDPIVSSDLRLKKDVKYLCEKDAAVTTEEVYDFFKNTYKPVTYKYNNEDKDNQTKIGFIAQDVIFDKVGSYLVYTDEDITSNDPNDLPELSYSQGNLEGLIAAALQEEIKIRDAQIENLQNQINELKELINNLIDKN